MSSAKPAVVVSIRLDGLGTKPAVQSGSGPISDDQLAYYAATSPIYALFTDSAGRPLWLGRTRRNATVAQFIALAVRDRGCGLCGASVQRCEAHHLVPWNAPQRRQPGPAVRAVPPPTSPTQPHHVPASRTQRANRLAHQTGHGGRNPTTPAGIRTTGVGDDRQPCPEWGLPGEGEPIGGRLGDVMRP